MIALSPADFDAHLHFMGQDVFWRQAYACPCRDSISGAAALSCSQCNGKGWTWGGATRGVCAFSGVKAQTAWEKFGAYEQGDLVISLPSDSSIYAIGEHDRVTLYNTTEAFSRVFTRHHDDDPLPFQPATISRCFWLENGLVVEGGIPRIDTSTLTLTWSANAPPNQRQYSLTGRKYPEFFVANNAGQQDRAHLHGQTLPRRIVLRRYDLFSRTS